MPAVHLKSELAWVYNLKMQKFEQFTGTLGNYEIIKTEDNSYTVLSEEFNEACHSLNGAINETVYNYIEGCQLLQNIKSYNPYNIFEMGFGVGIGLHCVIDFIKKNSIKGPIHFYSCELDRKLVQWAFLNGQLKNYKFANSESLNDEKSKIIELEYFNLKIFISIGNIRSDLKTFIPYSVKLHAIFQDPFSPRRNPICWTLEYFKDLKEISHSEVVLSTYSSSKSIRKSLVEAGWTISNRKGFGHKRLTTIATLTGDTNPEILAELARSPVDSLRD